MRTTVSAIILALLLSAPASAQRPVPVTGPLSLLDAVRLGRERATAAIAAQNNARAASARVGQRRADLLPQIAGSASWSRQTLNLEEFGFSFPGVPAVTPDFTVWRAQLAARQTLFDASLISRLRAARDNASAASFDARSAADLSGAIAGLAYLRVLGAEETVRARLQDSAVAASLLLQAHRLVDAGVSPTIDATRSEVSFAAVRTQLELARNAVGRTRLDLAAALDLPAATPLVLDDSLATPSLTLPGSADSAVAFARAHRTELAAEHVRTDAQRRTLGAIRNENLPSLGVAGTYQQGGQQTGNLYGSYALQVGVSVPILDGFKRQTRAGEQEALLDVQREREHQVDRQVEIEVRQSLLDLASAQDLMRIAADRVRLADDELTQAQQRFTSGVSGSVETTQSQAASILAHDAFIQARMAFAIARLGTYRSLGVLDQLR